MKAGTDKYSEPAKTFGTIILANFCRVSSIVSTML